MQPQLGIWKRFIRSLLVVDRCSLSLGSGRGFISGGQMQPQLGMWKRFIRSLLGEERCSLSWFIPSLLVGDRIS